MKDKQIECGGNTCHISRDNKINCDQVAWLLACFDRYLPGSRNPGICRQRDMQKFGMLYEVMEILRLDFEDDGAKQNGSPADLNMCNDSEPK